jgi:hypothetical protein
LYNATLLVRVDHVLDRVCDALAAHEGEVARSDYISLARARARASSILGPERVFGFGARGVPYSGAEVLCETVFRDGNWRFGPPRELGVQHPDVTDESVGDAAAFIARRLR